MAGCTKRTREAVAANEDICNDGERRAVQKELLNSTVTYFLNNTYITTMAFSTIVIITHTLIIGSQPNHEWNLRAHERTER